MKAAKVIISVHAGIILNEPLPEHSRQWSMTIEEWNDPEKFCRVVGEANMYQLTLLDPRRVNWVRMDWIWL